MTVIIIVITLISKNKNNMINKKSQILKKKVNELKKIKTNNSIDVNA